MFAFICLKQVVGKKKQVIGEKINLLSRTLGLWSVGVLSLLTLPNSVAWSAPLGEPQNTTETELHEELPTLSSSISPSSEHSSSTHAPTQSSPSGHLDYMLGTGAISAPFGAAAYADLGYSQLLWGKKSPGSFLYGFIRPAVKLQTSVLVNRAETYLDLYPISFFGISGGASATSRNSHIYAHLDCTTAECTGTLYRSWIKPKLSLGYKNLYWISSLKYENLNHSSPDAFADEVNVLIGHAGGDHSLTLDTTLGYQWSEKLLTGVHGSSVKMLKNQNMQGHMMDFYASYSSRQWKYMAGAGVYQSTINPISPTAYLLIQWIGIPSMALN